jgi:outer membrane beta-barrel protein
MKTITLTIATCLILGLFALPQIAFSEEEQAPPAPEAPVTKRSEQKKSVETNKPAATQPAASEEEIDVSDLAEEYWRPQKDDLEVVQNKRFLKANRLEASALYSFFQTHQYSDSTAFGLNLTYNISERWAVEASHLFVTNTESDFLTSVRKQYGFTPDFNNEKSQSMAMATWAPIYGKFSFLGTKISHFDFFLSAGAGVTETIDHRFTWGLALGNRFFIWKNLVFRFEFRVINYTDRIKQTQGSASVARGGPGFVLDDITRRNLVFGLGWIF